MNYLLAAFKRDIFMLAVWAASAVTVIWLGGFLWFPSPFEIGFFALTFTLLYGTQMIGEMRARKEHGLPIWGGWSSFYRNAMVAVIVLWFLAVLWHPENLSPFAPWRWQLPALQGYFTAAAAHFATLFALKIYDGRTKGG